MGRPKLPKDRKRQARTFKLAPETIARLESLAKQTADSQGVVIDKAIADYRPKPLK